MALCQQTRRSLDFGNFNARWTGRVCTDNLSIPLEEVSLAELVEVPSMFFGKWHEGANPTGGTWPFTPQAHGWGGWRGGVAGGVSACGGRDYFNWKDVEDGTVTFLFDTYQPTVQFNRWASWWNVAARGPRLALYSTPLAHSPYHRPPNVWLPVGYPTTSTDLARFESMIVACDQAIGRMLARMSVSDILIVVGDNGTPGGLIGTTRAKGTTYERGINVPLIVYGGGFKGTSDALVHVVDVYATVAELFGIPEDPGRDSRSLIPLMLGSKSPVHAYVLCGIQGHDAFQDDVCARSLRFKLRRSGVGEQFFDLYEDPSELIDLIADPAYAKLIEAHRVWLDAELED